MGIESPVTIAALSREWGVDKTTVRRYILRHGFDLLRVRSVDQSHQMSFALSASDADLLREMRSREGYTLNGTAGSLSEENALGVLYIVQVIPDVDPLRIKIGFAQDVGRRVAAYRIISPTVATVRIWQCRAAWERAAIDSIVAVHCTLIGGDVYTCTSLEHVLQRGDAFFACMPQLVSVQ